MLGLAEEIDTAIAEAVKSLRSYGYSWAEIGSRLGIHPPGRPATLGYSLIRPHGHTARQTDNRVSADLRPGKSEAVRSRPPRQ
jgi:hypothetical protein